MKRITIRSMNKADIDFFPPAFSEQGWDKPRELFVSYYERQQRREIQVFVAETDGIPAGYVLLLPQEAHGPFAGRAIPVISVLMYSKSISAPASEAVFWTWRRLPRQKPQMRSVWGSGCTADTVRRRGFM